MSRHRLLGLLDLTAAQIQRTLEPRLEGYGSIRIRRNVRSSITILHCYTSHWNGKKVTLPVAQLRARGDQMRLYWRRDDGRWAAYRKSGTTFTGPLHACLAEIDHDRWGCFWS